MIFLVASLTALWLGILTSISPCPMATNVAAIAFVGRRVGHTSQILLAGLLYTLGRLTTYAVLGSFLISGVLAIPGVAFGLQKYMSIALGPLLILTGIFMLGVIPILPTGSKFITKFQEKTAEWGLGRAFLLGVIFALSFCPVSAGLFFGSLIPLAIANQSRIFLPILYGVGTALPVVAFSFLIALSVKSVGTVFKRLSQIEKWARWVTSAVFILIGFYYTATFALN
jgi:cytochrome c-type biogenesis protein